MAEANSGGSKNSACIVNCIKEDGTQLLYTLIEELTGQKFSTQEINRAPVNWLIDNKYYCAKIELFIVSSSESWDKKGGHQAVIFLCDLDQPESLETMKSLWTQLGGDANDEETLPEVRVVMGVSTSSTSFSDMLRWCVGEAIELIEWERGGNPLPQDTDSDDGLPPEAVGVARLSETLQAHMWPNMTMKSRNPTTIEKQEDSNSQTTNTVSDDGLKKLEAKATATGTSKEESQKRVDDLLLTEEQLSAMKNEEDAGGESFEDLFSRFSQMKQHAESLPHEERKAYAEKVVMAFWNTIGGDDDELQ